MSELQNRPHTITRAGYREMAQRVQDAGLVDEANAFRALADAFFTLRLESDEDAQEMEA